MEDLFQSALDAFAHGDDQAITQLISIYSNGYRRNDILDILNEACYIPNEKEMRDNYAFNLSQLSSYPYVAGLEICAYDELPFQIYVTGEDSFHIWDKHSEEFTGTISISDFENKQIYQDSEPIRFFENEKNISLLVFLRDILRKSEDIACDNHLYLFYESFYELAQFLLITRIDKLLKEEKAVFLIGEEHRDRTISFFDQAQANWSNAQQKELKIDDIQRCIFGWKIANVTGTSFLADILDDHPNLLTIPDCLVCDYPSFYWTCLEGKLVSTAIAELRECDESDEQKSFLTRIVYSQDWQVQKEILALLPPLTMTQFLDELEYVLREKTVPTAKEWIVGIYLAYSRCRGRCFDNSRIIPALFLFPHDDIISLSGVEKENLQLYFELVKDFPYKKLISIIRDPVTQAGGVIRFMTNTHPNARDKNGRIITDPFCSMAYGTILPKDYYFPIQHPLYGETAVVRFEDLKLNPEATISALVEFLHIPLSPSLFQTTWCGLPHQGVSTNGSTLDGFDTAPIYNEHSEYLSVFDKYRIELLLSKLFHAYGYHEVFYDGQEFTLDEVMKMMELPFKCESIETAGSPGRKEELRTYGMGFLQVAAQINYVPFPFTKTDSIEQYAPLRWLRPIEALLRQPLYQSRKK